MKLLHLIIAISLVNTGFAQTISLDHFNKRVFTSDFNSAKDAKLWPSINNQEELIILNNEEYTVERKDFSKDRVIFPNWHSAFPDFEFNVSVNLQYLSDKAQSAGVCFAYSKAHETGFILEINKQKRYRIKQIMSDGSIKYISGSNAGNSWLKSNLIYTKQEFNQINILVLGNTIDIYLNNFFVYSFTTDFNYNFRDFGLYVSKGSKALFHHVYLLINHIDYGKYDQNMEEVDLTERVLVVTENDKEKTEEIIAEKELNLEENEIVTEKADEISKESELSTTENETVVQVETVKTSETNDPDVKKCLEMILNIRNDLTKSQKELETCVGLLENCKDDNARLNGFITMNMDDRLKNKAASLEIENERLKDEIQKLKSENATLQDFKNFYKNANKDEDIVNFLYDELKKIEEKNAYLARQVEILEAKLKNK